MTKRVLDIGNCQHDHGLIATMLKKHFSVEVLQAHSADEALKTLRSEKCDLVLVNRTLDADHADGLSLIELVKQDNELSAIPIMLISNYEQYQDQAMAAGAAPGFGKKQLNDPRTFDRLAPYLG